VAASVSLATSNHPVGPAVLAAVVVAFGVAVLSTLLFSRLRIAVRDGVISWTFGWGFPRFTMPISEVQSATVVRNPWFFGLGIHLTPWGTLYNVWGRSAVEITKTDGRRLRLGTDEPDALLAAIKTRR
jgi:hypothetical protein